MSPVQESAEIFAVQQVGAYWQFTVVAPGVAAEARPGQFVAVAVGDENTPMLLRRSFDEHDALCEISAFHVRPDRYEFVVTAQGPLAGVQTRARPPG